MGFFDNAQDVLGRGASAAQGMLDKGVSAAKGAVSGVAVEQQPFMKAFARTCEGGWQAGWDQGADGLLAARLTEEEASACRPFFYDNPSSWVSVGVGEEGLAGAYIAVTAQGASMRDVALEPARNAGIVEFDAGGDAWRIVWGFKDGGVPCADLPRYIGPLAASGAVLSCSPANVAALRLLGPWDDRSATAALWAALPPLMALAPRGVAVAAEADPAAAQVAQALSLRSALIAPDGSAAFSGKRPDDVFLVAHALDKAAGAYLAARAANGGSGALPAAPTAAWLRDWARAHGAAIDEGLLL